MTHRSHQLKIGIYICSLLCVLGIVFSAQCKRGSAAIVALVVYDNIQYIAPNDDGVREYIEAWDLTTKKKIWELTIFTNSIHAGLETDVQ
jgi:hypothetical protein